MSKQSLKLLLTGLILWSLADISQAGRQAVDRAFQAWINGPMWLKARDQGISRNVYRRAFKNVKLNWKLPDLVPPGRREKLIRPPRQSEFRSPGAYFRQSHLIYMVKAGRRELKTWKNTLSSIEKRYGVPRTILIAIWGKETAFGRARLPYTAISVLATQAFMGRRKALFEKELLAGLKILQEGHVSIGSMKSAWAGALGHPQFMPSVFLRYAVDFDGDGRKNIWTSVPDALASIANFLVKNGWNTKRGWGFEVAVPKSVACSLEGPDHGRSIAKWRNNNIRRVRGRSFSASELHQDGFLLMPAGRFGPAFIVTENFYVLKKYNESDVYALLVGHLADRFKHNAQFVNRWDKTPSFAKHEVRTLQTKLVMSGYDVGGIDGLIGYKTRVSLGTWQLKNKLTATCFPTSDLLRQMR